MQPKEKDPISMEIHEQMIKACGASIARVKKRLKETNLIYQLKPPEDEKFEVNQWEMKIKDMMNHKEKMQFPSVMDIKRDRAHRQQGVAETNAKADMLEQNRVANQQEHARVANERLRATRVGRYFGKKNTFGGSIEGSDIRTIEKYNGLNSVFKGERTLVVKDGRYTKQTQRSELADLPWVGPQYYGNLDPRFLATGVAPENISQIPFNSVTNSRIYKPKASKELRDERIIRRERMENWKNREPRPGYLKTPDRLSPEKLLRHHGYAIDEEGTYIKDQDTLATSVHSVASDPAKVLDRNTGQIVLGDLTRQLLLVEREDKVHNRLPMSKRTMLESKGPSQNKQKADAMLRDATSWITTSKTLSGKLARHERALAVAMEGGVFNGRIDYTKGALVNIDNEGAVAEETSLAPSITGTDHASEELLSQRSMESEDVAGPMDVLLASPVRRLLSLSRSSILKDPAQTKQMLTGTGTGEGDGLFEDSDIMDDAAAVRKANALAEASRVRDKESREVARKERQRASRAHYDSLSPIQKTFSKRKLPLRADLKPQISKWLNDENIVYHAPAPDTTEIKARKEREKYEVALRASDKEKERAGDGVDDPFDDEMSVMSVATANTQATRKSDMGSVTNRQFGGMKALLMSDSDRERLQKRVGEENVERLFEVVSDEQEKLHASRSKELDMLMELARVKLDAADAEQALEGVSVAGSGSDAVNYNAAWDEDNDNNSAAGSTE